MTNRDDEPRWIGRYCSEHPTAHSGALNNHHEASASSRFVIADRCPCRHHHLRLVLVIVVVPATSNCRPDADRRCRVSTKMDESIDNGDEGQAIRRTTTITIRDDESRWIGRHRSEHPNAQWGSLNKWRNRVSWNLVYVGDTATKEIQHGRTKERCSHIR